MRKELSVQQGDPSNNRNLIITFVKKKNSLHFNGY